MKTPSITEIKRNTLATSPFYFNRDTLRAFGQTMRSFKVKRSPTTGRVFIFAPTPVLGLGYSFREYVGGDLRVVRNDDGSLAERDTLAQVLEYIEAH